MIAITKQENKRTPKIAREREEIKAARKLVHDNYVQAGLIDPIPTGLHLTPFDTSPLTQVFIVKQPDDAVVSTLSLIEDQANGIPMEAIYPDEIKHLRQRDERFAEISCLASQDRQGLIPALAIMYHFAQAARIQHLLIAVHPHHAAYYERFHGFERFGRMRPYRTVKENPAIGLIHDINMWARSETKCKSYKQVVYDYAFSEAELIRHEMSQEDRTYFRQSMLRHVHS